MTTLIKETETTYEPTAYDKIQRVIYRLEHGEELISGRLYDGDNFCVLGLFADESGLGHWEASEHCDGVFRYRINGFPLVTSLHVPELIAYYDIRLPHELKGSARGQESSYIKGAMAFDLSEVSNDIANKIKCLWSSEFNIMPVENALVDLYAVNDLGKSSGYTGLNQLLADIIRSGVLFNSHYQGA